MATPRKQEKKQEGVEGDNKKMSPVFKILTAWYKKNEDTLLNGDSPLARSMTAIQHRSGTVSLGEEYEILVPALFGLQLIENKEVKDFNFKNNVHGFGALDDLIVFIKLTNGIEYNFAIQLKHKENKKNLQADAIEASKGDFSLKKYQKAFTNLQKRHHAILFTNLEFDFKNARKMKRFQIIKKPQCPGSNFFNTGQTSNSIYSFKEYTVSGSGKYQDFFKSFSLYVKQKNLKALDISIRDIIKQKYFQNDNTADLYINYFRNWRMKNFLQIELTLEHIKVQLLRLLLSPHMAQPRVIATQVDQRYTILEESIKQFDVSIAENLTVDFIIENWKQNCSADNQTVFDIGKQNNFITKDAEDITIGESQEIQYFYQQLPIIIKFDNAATHSILAALNLYEKGTNNPKLLLVEERVDKEIFKKNSSVLIFSHLGDLFLQNQNLYFTLIETFQISVQARKKVYLKDLISFNQNVAVLLTATELIKVLDESYFIGEARENLPDHYIPRRVSKTIFSTKDLSEIKYDVVVIAANDIINEFVFFIKTMFIDKVLEVEEYLACKQNQLENTSEKILIIKNEAFGESEYDEIVKRNKDKNIHFFQVINNEETVEWINSYGSIKQLEKLMYFHDYLKEEEIYRRFSSNLNIISAQPGTGKSILIKYLKNNCPATHWPIMIKLREHAAFFQEPRTFENTLEYILEKTCKEFMYDDISLKLRQLFRECKKIELFWDGLDELSGEQVDRAIVIIKEFQKNGYSQWVSCRTILKPYTENQLSALSTHIEDFTVDEQNRYIQLRLKDRRTPEEIANIIKDLYRNFSGSYLLLNNDILGTPLLLYMITDILIQNPSKYSKCIEELLVLSSLYRNFMTGKFRHYLSKRHTHPESFKALVDDAELIRFKMYQAVAVKSCFKSIVLQNVLPSSNLILLNSDQELFLDQFKKTGDYLGVVIRVNDDNTSLFAHHSYAEFFTAWWMALHIKEISNFKTFIFEKQFDNIRYFFDMLLAEKIPAHMAVLSHDYEKLEKYSECELLPEDEAGRTSLHLACSWGVRHPLLQLNNFVLEPSRCKFFQKTVPFYRSNTQIYEDSYNVHTVKLLCNYCDPFKVDTIYKLNAIEYADKTLLISAFEGLLSANHTLSMSTFQNFNNIYYLAYYSVDNNYFHLFKLIFMNVPLFYIDFPYRTLYEHAIELQRESLAKMILDNKQYRTAVQKACNVHEELKECLRKSYLKDLQFRFRIEGRAVFKPGVLKGLKTAISRNKKYINNYDLEGNTPLTLAAELGSVSVIRQLIEDANADINQRSLKGQSAILIANLCGFTTIVKYLEKHSNLLFNNVMRNPLVPYVREENFEAIQEFHEDDIWDISELREFRQHALPNVVIKNEEKILRYFIEKGVNIDDCNKNKETVLMLSAMRGSLKVTKILIEEGKADPNKVDKFGETALIKALRKDNYDIVAYLLDKTQNLLQQNKFRESFFTICVDKGIRIFDFSENNIQDIYLQLKRMPYCLK